MYAWLVLSVFVHVAMFVSDLLKAEMKKKSKRDGAAIAELKHNIAQSDAELADKVLHS